MSQTFLRSISVHDNKVINKEENVSTRNKKLIPLQEVRIEMIHLQ